MEQEQVQSTTPTSGRQVNKKDKNEIARCDDTIGEPPTDQETVLIEIPREFKDIVLSIITYLESNRKNPDYLKLCSKTKSSTETLRRRKYKTKTDFNKGLTPLCIIKASEKLIYLTEQDLRIILEYDFIFSRMILITILNQLSATTIKGRRIYEGIVYPWKVISNEDWKIREKYFLENWGYNPQYNTKRQVKKDVLSKLQNGYFKDQIEEIKQRIIENHS